VRRRGKVLPILAGLALAGTASAQSPANRARSYLVASDVTDARALWVNPGGLAAKPEASIMLELTARQPGAKGQFGQLSVGFNARGLAFGYQRDNLAPQAHAHTYRLGIGAQSSELAAGFAVAFHGGAIRGTGWDLGLRYDALDRVTLAGVVRDLGRPTVLGERQDVTFVPAITIRPLAAWIAVSGQAVFTSTTVYGYGVQANLDPPGRLPLGLAARLDTDRSGHRTGFTLALSLGRRDRVGVTGTTSGDFSRLDAMSVYGLSVRTPGR
jgi:hypothetical protein